MRLDKEAIEEFKRIYENEYHRPISDEQARRAAEGLLRLCYAIFKPIPSDNNSEQNASNDS